MTMRSHEPAIAARGVRKSFTLHLRSGLRLDALRDVDVDVFPSDCVVLSGPSGAGKSTFMRCIYGNYAIDSGSIRIEHRGSPVDMATADSREVHALRRHTLGHVSQFLRVIPRVPVLDIVAEPLLDRGVELQVARRQAGQMLERLGIAPRMFDLPPATFSGGEQQRVNIARVFAARFPILLLDEPTASLDDANRQVVVELVREARAAGCAILAILHDTVTRTALATRIVELEPVPAEVM